MNWDWKDFLKKALIRAIRTFAQTFASMMTIGALWSEIQWTHALSVAGVAFVYSILQFIQGGGGSYMLSPLQVMCDYFLAFTALGVSGFFKGKKNGLLIGYIIAVICRGAFHALGGYLFWMDYMPEDFFAPALYPILYNFAYLIPEMILTVIVIILPPVKAAIDRVRTMADQM